jgi:2-iminobutanoate/2-iminopropanoate deaminase
VQRPLQTNGAAQAAPFCFRGPQRGSAIMASDIVLTNPATIAAPGGHYTHAVTANGFVFVAGQLPIARDGTKLVEASFEQQAQLTLDNIAVTLQAAGSAIDRLVQVRVYLTDVASWTTFNAIYTTWIGLSRPARAIVPVPQLHYGFKIEIEAVALEGSS